VFFQIFRSIKRSYQLVFSVILLLSNLNISCQTDPFTIKSDKKSATDQSIIIIVGTDTLKELKFKKDALFSLILEYRYNSTVLFRSKDIYSKSVFINLGNVAELCVNI
jgi:hypothetical protein